MQALLDKDDVQLQTRLADPFAVSQVTIFMRLLAMGKVWRAATSAADELVDMHMVRRQTHAKPCFPDTNRSSHPSNCHGL